MVARPNDKLSAIRRPDNPSARSRKASRILRIGNLFIGFLSIQNERKNNLVKDRLTAAKSQANTGWPDAPVSLAGLNRYGWPDVIGISGRMIPEYADEAVEEYFTTEYILQNAWYAPAGTVSHISGVSNHTHIQ